MTARLDGDRWARVREIFDEAASMPAASRAAFIASACGDDEAMRDEVQSLLAHDDGVPRNGSGQGDWLERGFERAITDVARGIAEPSAVGGRIGRYHLISEIGRGGMGAVYLAERDDDFKQRVAIKIVRGVIGEDGLRRFRAERQILATLNHPCIATLIDGGATELGVPYLVMEYVEGVPIDEYCRAHALDTPQRLALFVRVADAVSHAHRSLIVHRDLKPSNILVIGGPDKARPTEGTPKLLDFGIAKLLDEDADAALQTSASLRLLTPEYASPEQMAGGAITTATDVYSLGVLLFEMLTGTRRHVEAGFSRPASRPALDRDLDTIVATALQEEPARRYASVQHLVEDLERYQKGLPVLARPSTWRYRSSRFVRRHRAAVATAGAFAVIVIGFTIALAFVTARAVQQRDAARRVTALLVEMFSTNTSQSAIGSAVTASELLDRGAVRIRRELADQPDLQAQVLDTIGAIYVGLGQPDKAAGVLKESLARRQTAHVADSQETARTMFMLADTLRARGQYAAAEPLARASVEMGRRVTGAHNPLVAQWELTLALILNARGKADEAERLFTDATQTFRDTLGPEHPMVAETLFYMATARLERGDLPEAERLARDALGMRRRAFGQTDGESLEQLAQILAREGGHGAEVESLLREALAARRLAYGASGHPSIAQTLDALAAAVRANGKAAEADALAREAGSYRSGTR